MILVLVLCLQVSFIVSDIIDIRIQDNCTTSDGSPGLCKLLEECPSAISTFANPKKDQITRLNSLLCDAVIPNTIYVCCKNEPLENVAEISDKRYCGFQHFDDLMVDIRVTSIVEYPWIAAIMKKWKSEKAKIRCLGALINTKYVVTSGFCANFETNAELQAWVRLGDFHLRNDSDCVTWQRYDETECSQFTDYDIDEAIVHPFLSHAILSINDIGLLRLKSPAGYSDYIRPICLPTVNEPLATETFYTSGWIDDEFKIKIPTDTVKTELCHQQDDPELYKYNRCMRYQTIDSNSKAHTCNFLNNGAPIMFESKKQWHLEGVSYLFFNLNNQCVARYTPIHPYIDWIKII
ncbi:hypothetical protein FQR65_LT02164 [Abscondita terminalis]|nr:hypothetical protein FQR65_LT02164 [Abscondita terminalis]